VTRMEFLFRDFGISKVGNEPEVCPSLYLVPT
jgi:hypothetical protein